MVRSHSAPTRCSGILPVIPLPTCSCSTSPRTASIRGVEPPRALIDERRDRACPHAPQHPRRRARPPPRRRPRHPIDEALRARADIAPRGTACANQREGVGELRGRPMAAPGAREDGEAGQTRTPYAPSSRPPRRQRASRVQTHSTVAGTWLRSSVLGRAPSAGVYSLFAQQYSWLQGPNRTGAATLWLLEGDVPVPVALPQPIVL